MQQQQQQYNLTEEQSIFLRSVQTLVHKVSVYILAEPVTLQPIKDFTEEIRERKYYTDEERSSLANIRMWYIINKAAFKKGEYQHYDTIT